MNTLTHITLGSMLKVIILVLGVMIFWFLKEVVFLVFLAFILSAAATYGANILHQEYKLNITAGISLVFGTLVAIIALIIVLLVPAVITEGYAFINIVPDLLSRMQLDLISAGVYIDLGLENIQDLAQLFPFVSGNALTIFQGAFEFFTFGFLTIMLGFYIAMDPEALNKILTLFVPRSYRKEFQVFLEKSRIRLGNWALSQVTISITTGIFLYTILAMTQVRYAILLSILWALSEIIPFVGPLLASIPILILAFSISPSFGILILVSLLVIQVIKFLLLIPIFIDKKARLNPFVVVVSLMIGGAILGPFGVLISTPVVSILTLLKDDLERYVNVDLIDKVTNQ